MDCNRGVVIAVPLVAVVIVNELRNDPVEQYGQEQGRGDDSQSD